MGKCNLFHEGTQEQICEPKEAPVLAMLTANVVNNCAPRSGSFAQQCNHNQGVKLCAEKVEAAAKEIH